MLTLESHVLIREVCDVCGGEGILPIPDEETPAHYDKSPMPDSYPCGECRGTGNVDCPISLQEIFNLFRGRRI